VQISVPVRLFSLPSSKTYTTDFEGKVLAEPRVSWLASAIMAGEAVKFYCDSDPSAGLNGSRLKVEAGELVDVHAVLRLYPRKSGVGVALERFEEIVKPAPSK
jgi:hypothetical protein